ADEGRATARSAARSTTRTKKRSGARVTREPGSPSAKPGSIPRVRTLVVLVAVTAVWGVTFVQVKDAVALYPLFAFLTLRFAIASCTLAPPGLRRLRTLGAGGIGGGALAGALVGAGDVLQTAG